MNKTYSLKLEGEEFSNQYYKDIKKVSDDVLLLIDKLGKEYIEEFMQFIKNTNIEALRSYEEYKIEFLLLGVLFIEYIDNARAFKKVIRAPFKYLNKKRNENKKNKEKIDYYRGILINKFLIKTKGGRDYPNIKGLFLLRDWLIATNDFNEEVYRINTWIKFFTSKRLSYVENALFITIQVGNQFLELAEKSLWKYTRDVYTYLEHQKERKAKREDVIFCGKNEIQYYFNMVCAEIMNKVYLDEYLKCNDKYIFLPGCMRQTDKDCASIITMRGLKCKSCTPSCNVNKVSRFAKENNMNVFIIPHESSIFKLQNYEGKKGLIGVACVLNLMSGGWKALRLGYIPQCVVLDYCGCKAHWQSKDIMTSININMLLRDKIETN